MRRDKLEDIEALLERLWGHLAVSKETRHKFYTEGYREGKKAGYREGRQDGFEEGFKEGKIFPSIHQPKDPLAG